MEQKQPVPRPIDQQQTIAAAYIVKGKDNRMWITIEGEAVAWFSPKTMQDVLNGWRKSVPVLAAGVFKIGKKRKD